MRAKFCMQKKRGNKKKTHLVSGDYREKTYSYKSGERDKEARLVVVAYVFIRKKRGI